MPSPSPDDDQAGMAMSAAGLRRPWPSLYAAPGRTRRVLVLARIRLRPCAGTSSSRIGLARATSTALPRMARSGHGHRAGSSMRLAHAGGRARAATLPPPARVLQSALTGRPRAQPRLLNPGAVLHGQPSEQDGAQSPSDGRSSRSEPKSSRSAPISATTCSHLARRYQRTRADIECLAPSASPRHTPCSARGP